MIWRKTGQSGFHGYPFYKFFEWLVFGKYGDGYQFGEEAPLVLLATVGALLSLWKTRRRFPLFAALWGLGLFAAYSIIEYKTPWLALSWLLPLAIAGGYAIDKLYRARGWRVVSLALLGVCLLIAAIQSYELNFVHYDDDTYPYVYAHTRREFHDLIARVEEITARTPDKYDAGINVAVENQEYWPLPWYIRDYKRIGYTGHVVETNDAVVLVKVSQVPQVESMLGSRYVRIGGTYPLRPGVDLALFGRRDLVAGQ
jgi:predicted membrane-bound mannosyltransferase